MNRLFEFPRLLVALPGLMATFVPLVRLFPLERRDFWRRSGVVADLCHLLANNGLRTLLRFFVLTVATYWAGDLVYPPLQRALAGWPRWGPFLPAVFVHEVGAYGRHRRTHTIPALWRFHAVHHSRERMDWLAAGQVHAVDQTWIRTWGVRSV